MGITPAGQSFDNNGSEKRETRLRKKKIPGVFHHEFSSELGGGTKQGLITLVALMN